MLPVTIYLGHEALIDHGLIQLKVTDIVGDTFFCSVLKGGLLKVGKEIFFPDIYKFINLKPIHEADVNNLKFAIKNDIDFIIASHVECALTIKQIKEHLNGSNVKVLTKIQNRYAVDEIDEIVMESDAIIFSPSIEIETKVIPFMYRMILSICKANMKPMFKTLDAPLEYSEECEVVNWLMSAGDGSMITRDAAEGREQLVTTTRLEGINSFIATHEEFCNQADEFCLHYHDQLVVLASTAVTASLCANASAIFILSENDLLARGVYFHLPKCVVIAIVNCDKVARQLSILNGFISLSYCQDAVIRENATGKGAYLKLDISLELYTLHVVLS